MALDVRDRRLAAPAVAERGDDGGRVPRLVRGAAAAAVDAPQQPGPQVREAHSEARVEADPSRADGPAEAGHPGDVLGDGDRPALSQVSGQQAVHQRVRQHQVDDGVDVGGGAKVLRLAALERDPEAVVVVEHRGHAVKPEAVEAELLHPEPQVREEVPQRLPVAVREQPRVPRVVPARGSLREVGRRGVRDGGLPLLLLLLASPRPSGSLAAAEVEPGDPVLLVRARVAVDDVEDHEQPQPVRDVDEPLEVVRGAAARGHRERRGHVVAEGAVVGVLGDGHQLDRVVARPGDPGEDAVGEVGVGGDVRVLGGHADVGLVDAERRRRVIRTLFLLRPAAPALPLCRRRPLQHRLGPGVSPLVVPLGAPVLGVEPRAHHVGVPEHAPPGPGGDHVDPPPPRVPEPEAVALAVGDRRPLAAAAALDGFFLDGEVGEDGGPDAVPVPLQRRPLPVVEVREEQGLHGRRGPLAEGRLRPPGLADEPKPFGAVGKGLERALGLLQRPQRSSKLLRAVPEVVLVRDQLRVVGLARGEHVVDGE